jgi:hypothetical protein
VTIDLGTDVVRNYQQAGLIAYVNDNLFTRLSHVAIWNTRQTEFGKEMPYAGGSPSVAPSWGHPRRRPGCGSPHASTRPPRRSG